MYAVRGPGRSVVCMVDRRAAGSWLGGPRSAGVDVGYPGQRLGLPESGPGSIATFGRRLLAFAVDVVLCDLIALGLLPTLGWNYAVFFVEVYLLTALVGGSFGHRVCGLYVVRLNGQRVGFLWALVRTFFLCLLIPALIWDRDFRGMHDRAANTVLLRT